MDKNQIGLAGEFYVLAQLAQRGLIGTLTLGHTKGIDILVSDSRFRHLFRVEVKTTRVMPGHAKLFGEGLFYSWPMSRKHESIKDERLFYCFVHLGRVDQLPRFFIVPSKDVASYVKRQHRKWMAYRGSDDEITPMRRFRIPMDDPKRYLNNWMVFKKSSNQTL